MHYPGLRDAEVRRICGRMGMEVNSTMGFTERIGNPWETLDEFTPIDFLEHRTLLLPERPLVRMESAMRGLPGPVPEEHMPLAHVYRKIPYPARTGV